MTAAVGVVGGLDYGHSHLRVGIATMDGGVLAEQVEDIDTNASPQAALALGSQLLRTLLDHTPAVQAATLRAVAVGLPSPIRPDTGLISVNNILPNWVDTDPGRTLGELLHCPVIVDNDCNLAALAETSLSGSHDHDLIYIKASSGIGAGLVLNGELYRSSSGLAGEIGHVAVAGRHALCRCGSRGCLESVCSLNSVITDLHHLHPGLHTAAQLVALAHDRDAATLRAVADAGALVGETLAGLCNVLAPRSVVVGGELAQTGESFIEPLRRALHRHTQTMLASDIAVRQATFGVRNELVGALRLAIDHAQI